MADRIIIAGTTRGHEDIPISELKQMCVDGSSRICLFNGENFYKEAKDIVIGDIVSGIKDDKIIPGKVVKIYKSKNKTKKINFSNGTEIIVSNHPLLSWNDGWVNSDNLKIGDKIRITNTIPFKGNNLKSLFFSVLPQIKAYCRISDILKNEILEKYSDDELKKFLKVNDLHKFKKKNNIVKLSSALGENLGIRYIRSKNGSELDLEMIDYDRISWLLGLLASDGNIKNNDVNTCLRLSLKDKNIIEECYDILKCSGLNPSIKRGRKRINNKGYMWDLTCSSFILIQIISLIGIGPRKTWTLDLEKFKSLLFKDKMQFIIGFIEGDGSFSKTSNNIRICSASKKCAYDIKELLLSIGISSVIRFYKGSGIIFGYKSNTEHYIVTINRVSFVNDIIKNVKISNKLPKNKIILKRNTSQMKGDTFYTKVEKIENYENIELYNFQVENCNTFIVEDIITHNCGRAGRSHSCPIAFADIVLGKSDKDSFLERYDDPAEMEVYSTFSIENIGFYLLPEISNGRVKTIKEAEKWYSRSLHSNQGFEIDMEKVFSHLVEHEAILKNTGKYFTTYIGDISTMFYFKPEDVFWWKNNFDCIFADCMEDNDSAIGWALANIPTKRGYFDARILGGTFSKGKYRSNSSAPYNKMNIPGHYLFEDNNDGKITACLWVISMGGFYWSKANARTGLMREDFGRIFSALSYLDKHCEWEMYDFLENLKFRVKYKVSAEVAELAKLPVLTVPNAKELLSLEIYCLEDIIENEDYIKLNCSFLLRQHLVRFLDGIR